MTLLCRFDPSPANIVIAVQRVHFRFTILKSTSLISCPSSCGGDWNRDWDWVMGWDEWEWDERRKGKGSWHEGSRGSWGEVDGGKQQSTRRQAHTHDAQTTSYLTICLSQRFQDSIISAFGCNHAFLYIGPLHAICTTVNSATCVVIEFGEFMTKSKQAVIRYGVRASHENMSYNRNKIRYSSLTVSQIPIHLLSPCRFLHHHAKFNAAFHGTYCWWVFSNELAP